MALLPEISQICLGFNPFGSTIQSLTMQRNTLHDTYQKLMIFGLRLSFCSRYLYWVTFTVLFSLIKKLPCGFAAQTRYVGVLLPALFPALFSSALYQFACKLDEFSFKLHGKIEGQNREADADGGSEGFSIKAMSKELANRALKTKYPNIFQFLFAFT